MDNNIQEIFWNAGTGFIICPLETDFTTNITSEGSSGKWSLDSVDFTVWGFNILRIESFKPGLLKIHFRYARIFYKEEFIGAYHWTKK